MIRVVPNGINVGQFLRPLVDSHMTNGMVAPAGVRYEVRVTYPGGVIIKATDSEDPGGLLRLGTPVHVEGEPEVLAEELARIAHAGHIPTPAADADAADFARPPAPVGAWDYEVVPSKALTTPRQAAVICKIILDDGRTHLLDSQAIELVKARGELLQTKQPPESIFKYYRSALKKAGFLAARP